MANGKPGPPKGSKRTFDPAKHCGARKTDGSGGRCTHPKGWGVPGTSDGPCRKHGGKAAAANVKHGLTARIKRDNLRERLEGLDREASDVMDLMDPSARLLYALAEDFIERYDQFSEAILAWHNIQSHAINDIFAALESKNPAKLRTALVALKESLSRRPKIFMDVSDASLLLERMGKQVERIHKIRTAKVITGEDLAEVIKKMLLAVARHCPPEKVARIQSEWEAISW